MSIPAAVIHANTLRAGVEPAGTVGIPVRDFMHPDTVMSILGTDWSDLPVDILIRRGNILTLQRNSIVGQMRGDWVLFIDDDMVWPQDAVKRLVASLRDLQEAGENPDILGALCFRRAFPYQPTLYVQTPDGAYNFLEDWEGRYIEVDATGMAFALVTKQCFERIAGTEMPPYDDRMKFDKHPDFFRWHAAMGEDLRFCRDVKEAGGRILIDTDVRIGHISEVSIGHEDFLRAVMHRTDEEQETRQKVNDSMNLPTLTRAQARMRLGG